MMSEVAKLPDKWRKDAADLRQRVEEHGSEHKFLGVAGLMKACADQMCVLAEELEAALRKDVEELRRLAKDSFHNEWPQSGVQIKSTGLDAAADYMESVRAEAWGVDCP